MEGGGTLPGVRHDPWCSLVLSGGGHLALRHEGGFVTGPARNLRLPQKDERGSDVNVRFSSSGNADDLRWRSALDQLRWSMILKSVRRRASPEEVPNTRVVKGYFHQCATVHDEVRGRRNFRSLSSHCDTHPRCPMPHLCTLLFTTPRAQGSTAHTPSRRAWPAPRLAVSMVSMWPREPVRERIFKRQEVGSHTSRNPALRNQ